MHYYMLSFPSCRMFRSFFLVFIFFVLVRAQDEVQHSEASTRVKVLGQSGKIRLEHAGEPIVIDFDYLSEVTAAGEIVGQSGSNKHSVNSFATQSFVFTPVVEEPYLGVPVKKFTFESPIYAVGHLRVVVLLIQENATIDTGAEQWSVSRGDMKFNIELRDWTFCGPCDDGVADFIELGIEIKSSKETDTEEQAKTIDIGGAVLQLASEAEVDGAKVSLPSGYPKVIAKGTKKLFVFRFPKFNSLLSYDPLLQLGETSSALVSFPSALCLLLGAVLLLFQL